MTTTMFDTAYTFVQKEEGGYVDDPADSGGATMAGVIQSTYDAYRKSRKLPPQPVRLITKAERRDIFEGIWNDCSASKLPRGLGLLHFDFAVNAGNRRAAVTLQRALGVADDGVIGSRTLQAANDTTNTEKIIIDYSELRRSFYRRLAEQRPKDKKFLKGWLLRTNRAERAALQELKNGVHE
jgi:lysozyme family protein